MELYAQFGLAGGMLASCFTAIHFLVRWLKKKDEEHSKERNEWLRSLENITDKSDKTTREINTVIRENSSILFGLKALLENQSRK